MSADRSWVASLVEVAADLRPRPDGFSARVLHIAEEQGIEVWLKGISGQQKIPAGSLSYTNPPRIYINRATKSSFERRLRLKDETSLSVRDRFTLAHEIAHWVAFARFGITPAAARSEYWRDEEAMSAFAAVLLMPDWQVNTWLRNIPAGTDIYINRLIEWAHECLVSPEAVSIRISELRNDVGFLKLLMHAPNRRSFPKLVVKHSAYGTTFALPGHGKIILNERLATALQEKQNGERKFEGLYFDSKQRKAHTLYCSWTVYDYEIRPYPARSSQGIGGQAEQSATTYWTSWGNKGFISPRLGEPLPRVY